jgi:hypothetical protein
MMNRMPTPARRARARSKMSHAPDPDPAHKSHNEFFQHCHTLSRPEAGE